MASPPNARKNAQSHFSSSQQREDAVRAEIAKEKSAVDAKTARLKALRLAKEAEEKIESERLAAAKAEEKARAAAQKRAKTAAAGKAKTSASQA